jgi:hypothetical protein
VTLNGELMTNIVFWTDAEIEFIPPFEATSGDLVVTSSSYGSDSSANEAGCPGNYINGEEWDYCGNDEINATFAIATVNAPAYWLPANSPGCTSPQPCSNITGTQSTPQYVAGTWYWDDGGGTVTITLSQGAQNSDGTWPITGTEVNSLCAGNGSGPGLDQFDVTGTLDQYGDFALYSPCPFTASNIYCVEWLALGSGDVTSQGLGDSVPCFLGPPVPTPNFLDGGMDQAEGYSYESAVPPLFRSRTDKPPSESVLPQGWWTGPGSTLPTYGLWERVLPPVNSFTGFAGRFVYEQSGGPATDGCYFGTADKYAEVTSTLSGGGWFVDQNGDWGYDTIGLSSGFDSYYQGYYGPEGLTCQITGPQALYTGGRTGPSKYITDTQRPAEITPTELLTGVAPGSGQMVTECEPYPKIKGKCR